MMSLIRDIDLAVVVAKRWGWGMIKWQVGLNIRIYDTRVADTCETVVVDRPTDDLVVHNLDDAMQKLFDLSTQGYEIFQIWGDPGLVSFLVQPSLDHSTNIDIDVMNSIVALFGGRIVH